MAQSAGSDNVTRSIWSSSVQVPSHPPLLEDAQADVCIVGAGISGLTTAYLLARAGRSVLVLDDGDIGGGETQRTTAHLANALDDRYMRLERLHGVEGARLAADSHSAAVDEIERIVEAEGIACDFVRVDGYLFVPPDEDASLLDRELDAVHRAGLTQVERRSQTMLGACDLGPSLRFPRQAQFDPMKYLIGLAQAIERAGGRIHGHTHVRSVDGKARCVRAEDGARVVADAFVVATNTPVIDRVAIHTKQAAYRTYVVAFRMRPGMVARALYWDTADPYHYVRTQRTEDGQELLIVGGEDHKTGQADESGQRFARLAAWTLQRVPDAGEIAFQWSGQVMEPVDALAFIGRNPGGPDNVYVVTGDSGNGMTHGTIAGLLLGDLIAGRENPWEKLYDPSRVTLRAAPEFARENLNVAAQYAELATPGEIESVDALAAGTGAVMRRGLKMIAAYRDEHGVVHERSAICPHLGCVVAWNDVEHSWDCPCHGSRFEPLGRVINGPANTGLPNIDESSASRHDKARRSVHADTDRQ